MMKSEEALFDVVASH